MIEQLAVLRDLVTRLERAGIPYMITGSLAMNHYARPRMTRDIDVVVELDSGDASRIEEIFGDDYYLSPDSVKRAIKDRGMFNIIHFEHALKADLIVRKDAAYRRLEFERRKRVQLDDLSLWIVSAEDLLLSKLVWHSDSRSEMQLRDIRNLVDCVADLDWGYIGKWAAELGVAGLAADLAP